MNLSRAGYIIPTVCLIIVLLVTGLSSRSDSYLSFWTLPLLPGGAIALAALMPFKVHFNSDNALFTVLEVVFNTIIYSSLMFWCIRTQRQH